MFIAKCIQDGRRVDLPLSAPFFKLMCTPYSGGGGSSSGGGTRGGGGRDTPLNTTTAMGGGSRDSLESSSEGPVSPTGPHPPVTPTTTSPPLNQPISNPQSQDNDSQELNNSSNQRSGSRTGPSSRGGGFQERSGLGEAGLKEAELVLASHMEEISKDGSPKDEGEGSTTPSEGEGAWFEGILTREDFDLVNPYRSRFLRQLEEMERRREEIEGNQELGVMERERQLASLTLPGKEENLPGARLEDLW